ncbi:MAG TPA: superoxide dismutase family protein [Thermoanaerobaculia bacterium]|nr:superoxide dismutase family protein [Thermoanaerobaculia bacterium]
MKKGTWVAAGLAVAAMTGILACASSKPDPTALAIIEPRSDSKVSGKVVFTQEASGQTKAEIWIANATPGMHGLHIHEKGDCSAPDAASAGGHFNSAGNPHAAPTDKARHNGDFGNIEIGADGKGHMTITTDLLTVTDGPNSVVGKSVIFHEKADDLKTQPTGASGARYGCGVVVLTPTGNASEIRIK